MNSNITLADIDKVFKPPFMRRELPGGFVLFDYSYAYPGLFEGQDAVLRECRGIIFKPDGSVLSRPYHKFFNANETEESILDKLDFTRPHVILEKLDGSMIRPLFFGGFSGFGTRKGATDVASQVNEWVKDNTDYIFFCKEMEAVGYTSIFEWCSRKMQIVIDHPVDRLVLTGMRFNETGEYVSYEEMSLTTKHYEIECVKAFDLNAGDTTAFLEYTRTLKDMEGFVIRFEDDGTMIKVKAEEYLRIHRTIDIMRSEKTVIELLCTGEIDDAKPRLKADDLKAVEEFEKSFHQWVNMAAGSIARETAAGWTKVGGDRKRFALEVALPTKYSHIMFGIVKEPTPEKARELMLEGIKKNLGNLDEIRDHMLGGLSWKARGLQSATWQGEE